jgi:thioredoxin-related protein
MIKKTSIAIGVALFIVVLQSFISENRIITDEASPVKWMTFSQAVEAAKKTPKPIMVDVYTQWCGPCKMMSKNTFGNEKIAKYLNENFYCVKFDAESFDSVAFNGYVFKNNNPPGTQRPVHDFAVSILDGKLSYPSIVFLNEQIQRIEIIVGYYQPEPFEPIMKFIGSGKYKEVKWDEYQKTFVSDLK